MPLFDALRPLGKEGPGAYAQRRADETGRSYATFSNPESAFYTYAAVLCVHNRRVYASLGATDVRIYRPSRKPASARLEPMLGGRFGILSNGFQWGPPTSVPDASGAYPDTWETAADARAAWAAAGETGPIEGPDA